MTPRRASLSRRMPPAMSILPILSARRACLLLLLGLAMARAAGQGMDADWFPVDANPLFDGPVRAMAEAADGTLYFAGEFSQVGAVAASNIASWDGSTWSALGSGTNARINAIALSGGELYAAGEFSKAGGATALGIARWDGSEWSALGSGLNGKAHAVAASRGEVHVGGKFTTAGGANANNIAVWDGSSWSALGSGTNNTVRAIDLSGSTVRVGGDFTSPASHVASWNGESWSALGSGLNRPVACLASDDGSLVAGGSFFMSGTTSLGIGIAQWNGSAWLPVGSGASGTVRTVAIRRGEIFAGGSLTTAGGSPAANIARWDGDEWSAFGSGTDDDVLAMLVSVQDLFVGGAFTMAGGMAADRVAATTLVYEPEFVFELDGEGIVDPGDPIEIRSVVDGTGDRLLTITNIGNRAGDLPDVAIVADDTVGEGETDPVDSSELFAADTSGYDAELALGESTSLVISGTPEEDGTFRAVLEIGNEADEDVETITFPLSLVTTDAATLYAEAAAAAGLEDDDALPDATPFDDGIANILKYAFNLPLDRAGGFAMAADGSAGLPIGRLVEDGGSWFWELTYLRRRGSGLVDTPMISTELGNYAAMTGEATTEFAATGFERVTVAEPVDLGDGLPRFSVVEVVLPEVE